MLLFYGGLTVSGSVVGFILLVSFEVYNILPLTEKLKKVITLKVNLIKFILNNFLLSCLFLKVNILIMSKLLLILDN